MFVILEMYFYDLEKKKPGSRNEVCATPGQSSLKSMKPGLSRKSREEWWNDG